MKTKDEKSCINPDCGKIHSAKEIKRVYGKDSSVSLGGFCSSQCYTAVVQNKILNKTEDNITITDEQKKFIIKKLDAHWDRLGDSNSYEGIKMAKRVIISL